MKRILSAVLMVLLAFSATGLLAYADESVPAGSVASITTSEGQKSYYPSLADALKVLQPAAMYDGAILDILQDVTCAFWWDGTVNQSSSNVIQSANVIINGNGYTVTVGTDCGNSSKNFLVFPNGVQINDLTLVLLSGGGPRFNGGDCTLNQVNITVKDVTGVKGGVLTDGTTGNPSKAFVTFYVGNGSSSAIQINGGRFAQENSGGRVVDGKAGIADIDIIDASFIGGSEFRMYSALSGSNLYVKNCYFDKSFITGGTTNFVGAVTLESSIVLASTAVGSGIIVNSGIWFNTRNKTVSIYGENGLGCFAPELISMQDGASVRLHPETSGIRFTSDISEKMRELAGSVSGMTVEYGTLVVRKDQLGDVEFTVDSMTAAGIKFVECKAEAGMDENGSAYRAAIIGIPQTDYGNDICARSYVRLTVGSKTVYLYSDYSEESNCRNIREVAGAALQAHESGEITYSEAELAILRGYAAAE